MGIFIPLSDERFDVFADENLDADERIGIIQDRLCELKKTYLSLKSEIAVIDRKRKRLRRREAG